MNPSQRDRCNELYQSLLPNMADYVADHARGKSGSIAIIEYNTGDQVTWKEFNTAVDAFSAKLRAIGLSKGDVVATSLPLLKEHIYLMYACYRIGLVIASLDLRLKSKEILYCMDKIKPKAYFFLGKTPVADFRPMIREIMPSCPSVRHWVQFQKEKDLIIDGAVGIVDFTKDIKKLYTIQGFQLYFALPHK